MRHKLGIRRRLQTVIVITTALGSIACVAIFGWLLHARLDSTVNDILTSRSNAQIQELSTSHGRVGVGEAPDDGSPDSLAWIFDQKGSLLEGPAAAPEGLDAAVKQLSTASSQHARRVDQGPIRLLSVAARTSGHTIATVVVGVPVAPYRQTEHDALVVASGIAALLIAVALVASSLLLRAVLAPIEQMTADAAAWSEHDLGKRFDLGPPTDELTTLAATFDSLLDRVAAGIRRERRVTDELSHELRTPLTRLSTQAQLLRDDAELPDSLRGDATGIVEATAALSDVLETLLTAARAEHGTTKPGMAEVNDVIHKVVTNASDLATEHGVRLSAIRTDPEPAFVAAEPKLVERILMPLVENACRYGDHRATISVARPSPSWMEIAVIDDGPGVAADERDSIFEPGTRGTCGEGVAQGAGLGLALARRLSAAVDGEISVSPTTEHGAKFIVRLPSA